MRLATGRDPTSPPLARQRPWSQGAVVVGGEGGSPARLPAATPAPSRRSAVPVRSDNSERVDVSARIDVGAVPDLLGSHIRRRAHDVAAPGRQSILVLADVVDVDAPLARSVDLGDPEVVPERNRRSIVPRRCEVLANHGLSGGTIGCSLGGKFLRLLRISASCRGLSADGIILNIAGHHRAAR